MAKETIGILHPGLMGVSIAAAAKANGYRVVWASQGRSPGTHARAAKHGFEDVGTVKNLCSQCEAILTVCPPSASETIAREVVAAGYKRLYCDATAVSPNKAATIARLIADAGGEFADGGIIGPPAWNRGTTVLYLSGTSAETVASVFRDGPLDARVIGSEPNRASALRMCHAANTEGGTALICGILAAAKAYGVKDDLLSMWSRGNAEVAQRTGQRVSNVANKAWRYAGEMDEISAGFTDAGLPGGFHAAASDLFKRIAGFKDASSAPELDTVLGALLDGGR